MQPGGQRRLPATDADLEQRLEDLAAGQRDGFGAEVVERGRVLEEVVDRGGAGEHQRAAESRSANWGMTSFAKSRMLASTCSCGMVSRPFNKKLMPLRPSDSHRFNAATM